MGSIDARLRRLEGGDETCPECGWDGNWSRVRFEVTWDDLDADPDDLAPPERYQECGCQLEYVVTWGGAGVGA